MRPFHRREPPAWAAVPEFERIVEAGVRLPGLDYEQRATLDAASGYQLFYVVADLSPDGWATNLEFVRTVDDYETALRSIAAAAGRGGDLTGVECSHAADSSVCAVRFTFAGTRKEFELEWDRVEDGEVGEADADLLMEAADLFAPPGRSAVQLTNLDDKTNVFTWALLYVADEHFTAVESVAWPDHYRKLLK